jgi:hypothetical protein
MASLRNSDTFDTVFDDPRNTLKQVIDQNTEKLIKNAKNYGATLDKLNEHKRKYAFVAFKKDILEKNETLQNLQTRDFVKYLNRGEN